MRVTLTLWLFMLNNWLLNLPNYVPVELADLASSTVVRFNNKLSELISDISFEPIGGPGTIVQVDENRD